ncbi:hypothetical protein HDV03_004562 [Kappamyces sp. JEL0829]|nr:hypothetical protein HDV03_004562 [Kappamyces sp. JEL0829]
MEDTKYPCKSFACAIQKCMVQNNHNETACQDIRTAFEDCCMKHQGQETAKEACLFVWKKKKIAS